MQGIRDAGFTYCTPIQAQTLPIALSGRDVAGQAQTGTGKTAAFLVALYQALLTRPAPASRNRSSILALIVAPTRELAVQIHHDAEILGRHTGFRQALGFIADIRYLLRRLPHPEKRQSMLFSATLSHRVLELAYEHMNNPELVRIEPDKMTVDLVRQMMYYPAMEEKLPLLVGLLRLYEARRTMIFVNTKRVAERLESTLKANGFHAQALSGDVPQNKRLKFLRDFHNGDLAVLIATDVASRGLHIPDVSHVFNFDLPQEAADYVHRIGRTARAGTDGDAISFACEEFAVSLPEIESYIGHKIPSATIPPELLATEVTAAPPGEYGYRPRPPRSGGHSGQGPGRRPPPGRRGAHQSKGARGRGR
jgi:ATP-dependent RNA helicase RhlB